MSEGGGRVEERIADIRRELIVGLACGGPGFPEHEEELLCELAALEHDPGGEPRSRAYRELSLVSGEFTGKGGR